MLEFYRYALAIGPRQGFPQKEFLPENISEVFIGTTFLWVGWFGFNGMINNICFFSMNYCEPYLKVVVFHQHQVLFLVL